MNSIAHAAPSTVDADAVVIAVPAAPASRLLGASVPAAAADLAAIDYASMAIVTLALPPSAFPNSIAGSGFLVPAVEGRVIKAATFSSVKWGWYPGDLIMVRCSIGRHGDVEELQQSDDELIAVALRDLAVVAGLRGVPIDAIVSRWGGGLPQYGVGHVDRVAAVRAMLPPTLAVAGAAYDGVGIAACVRSGEAAAEAVAKALNQMGE